MDPPQPQDVVEQQQQQLQQPLGPDPNAPIVNAAGENLQCQWRGCGERCTSPEALYEHVCERHVGRKSTNNLNLTCAWGQCNTTTVKRDHITSHIRVHVPLKPHKCEFCGKAFKRPQDLKKHVKTHADDSVIMRSPEPNGGQRGQTQGMVYDKAPQGYYQPAMPPQDYSGQHPANQYYQPQQHPQMQAGQHPGYGPVSYYPAPTQASYGDFESRKRGFDALDQFFGQVKRREFDPVNYQNVSRRLFELQGLQLPIIAQQPISAIPAYQPVAAMGGDYDQADPIQAYSLPPMGNAKTREDLTSIDQILEQMQATIYENDTHLAQAGVAQPGASYVAYRTSNSPPSAHLPSTHAHSSMLQHQHHGSIASASDSGATPGLTPPSSAHSPMVGSSAPGSGGMYPTLPANASDMAYTAANAATLSNQWENEDLRRRYGGGMLQRAQPARKNSADMDRDGSATPPAAVLNKQAKGKKKPSPKNSVIDPALSGDAGTPGSSKSAGEIAKSEEDRERDWVQNMRLIEWMRDFIKKKIEAGQYEGGEQEPKAELDTNMGGTEDEHKKDQEQLYPVLQAVEAES